VNSLKNFSLRIIIQILNSYSGKTTLVEHVATLTGRTIQNQGLLKVQLGDQTDAKVLLGTYHSTDVPGEFIWTAGILTQVPPMFFSFFFSY